MFLYIAFLFSLIVTLIIVLLPKERDFLSKKYTGICVIIPAYNSEKTIGECIGSVLNTNYPDLEIIVVNDGSTDCTAKEVERFKDVGVRLVNQKNEGKFAALNKGFSYAGKPIIFALDADLIVEKKLFLGDCQIF